jgi:hypothetical protein
MTNRNFGLSNCTIFLCFFSTEDVKRYEVIYPVVDRKSTDLNKYCKDFIILTKKLKYRYLVF